ncbi:MAG: hypothetical protein ACLQUY_09510 [Ktedonobacterales bacterium]
MTTQPAPDQPRARALRIYRWVLRLYPAAHRRDFGEPMLQTFGDCYHDAVEREGMSEAQFWLGVLTDESRSLIREHLATLSTVTERIRSMDKLLSAVAKRPVSTVAALLLWVVVLDLLSQSIPSADAIAGSWLFFWLAATVIYGGVLLLVARFAQSLPFPAGESSWRGSWWRLGLVLGGILGIYMVALTAVNVLIPVLAFRQNVGRVLLSLPFTSGPGMVWAISLPLLAGTAGIIGAHAGGKVRIGMAVGALAGTIMMATQTAIVGLLVLLSIALYHTAPPPVYFNGAQLPMLYPAFLDLSYVGQYLVNGASQASLPFGLIFQWIFAIIVWLVPLVVGSVLGVRTVRQTDTAAVAARHGWVGRLFARPIRFAGLALLLIILGPVLWLCSSLGQSGINTYGNPFAVLAFASASYVIAGLLIWLLAVLASVVAISVTTLARRSRPPGASAAPAQ